MTDCGSPTEGLRALALVALVVGAGLPVSVTGTAAAAAGNSTDGFVYVDGSDGNPKSVRANGSVVDYGVGDAKVIGPRADIDGDGHCAENTTVNVDDGERYEVNVSHPGSRDETVGFEELDMSVDDADSFEVNVTHAEGPPMANSEQYDRDSGRDTLQYVRLNHSVDAGDTYNDTAVSYRVDKADVPAGTDPEEVRLHRWDGSDWSFESSGTLVAETASEYVYRVNTPGFSQFVLTGPEDGTGGSSGGSDETDSTSLAGATTDGVGGVSVAASTVGVEAVEPGETVTATATLRNDGADAATFTAVLTVDGRAVAERTVSLTPGGEETVAFTRTFDRTGTYEVTVAGTDAGAIRVSAPDDGDDGDGRLGTDGRADDGDDGAAGRRRPGRRRGRDRRAHDDRHT